jgi:GTP-binding protein Era
MVEAANRSMGEVDKILFLAEPGRPRDQEQEILQRLTKQAADVFLVINKMDKVPKPELLTTMDAYQSVFPFAHILPVSAKTGENVSELLQVLFDELPEGPAFFPDDMLTDQPERQLMAEFIREKALLELDQEIPHGIAVMIDTFTEREDKNLIDIDATIICEKESHKPIIIGKGGRTLKAIGSKARREMEDFLGVQVNLKLWVKVKDRWRDSEFLIRNFGFDKRDLQ